jgi:phage terminase large subunit
MAGPSSSSTSGARSSGRRITLTIPTAEVFEPLLHPSRYKGAHGGRGSGKSWFFAGLLVEDHIRNPGMRSVCIREIQKDLASSAMLVIADTISRYQVPGFRVLRDQIQCPGNGVILFKGMNDYNADSIKSLEKFDRAWVEEAQTFSESSLKMLRPTIRADNSEIWFSWNPRRRSDPVDKFLRSIPPPEGAVVVQANWRDNPWFTQVLEAERKLDAGADDYGHIWGGEYVTIFKGAYYAKQLREAKAASRITRLARDPNFQIRAYWDIGGPTKKSDAMTIWLAQFVGREIRYLAYCEGIGQPLGYYFTWLRDMGADRCECIFPHDGVTVHADNPTGKSVEAQATEAGFKARTVPNQGPGAALQRVNAARRLFPRMVFDEKGCEAGLEALGAYAPNIVKREGEERDMGPDHNWASHGSDSFGLSAVDYQEPSRWIGPTLGAPTGTMA